MWWLAHHGNRCLEPLSDLHLQSVSVSNTGAVLIACTSGQQMGSCIWFMWSQLCAKSSELQLVNACLQIISALKMFKLPLPEHQCGLPISGVFPDLIGVFIDFIQDSTICHLLIGSQNVSVQIGLYQEIWRYLCEMQKEHQTFECFIQVKRGDANPILCSRKSGLLDIMLMDCQDGPFLV